ncbi:MAG: anaerobic selenocysteine-containing dehydrogenase [Candidatus Aldehydirespiratoraceae bacterium]|jgi:anaerobic selenocysteine-containing dehydrogenase
MTDTADRAVFRTCPLCEATCGLEIEIKDGAVKRIRGDREDVFSKGFICPKGSTLKQLHEDPDRLRKPLVRRGFDDSGAPVFEEVSWPEAYAEADRVLRDVRERHGNEAVGMYLGNPGAHVLGAATHTRHLIKGLGAGAVFSASTVDQMPRHVASGYLYGSGGSMPVPDIDRTDLFVCLGANPYASNGSIATVPDFPGRIEALQERGGRMIVIDPRRSRTAEQADLHLPIRPGTDAVLLAAIVRQLLADGHVGSGSVADCLDGLDQLRAVVEPFTAAVAAEATGISEASIEALATEIGAADKAAVYGRIGTCTVEFGTLTTWLLDVVAILTGNLDQPGGAMFPQPSHDRVRADRPGRPYRVGRRHSRVNQRPEVQGEFPVADLPDEILEPGDGQLRMMVTVAGNPVLSCPDGDRMDEAFASLDAMISVDIYLNETTRHASVILPPPGALEKSHYDLNFTNLSVRNVANFSPAVFDTDMPTEEDILATLALIALGVGPDADPNDLHDQVLTGLLQAEIDTPESPVAGRDLDELLAMVEGDTGSERVLDAMLRTGVRGDGFGTTKDGLSLDYLRAHPHGIDFGALEPRLPGHLRTPEARIDLFAGPFAEDLHRLQTRVTEWAADGSLRLVGRRHLRSNNSWMHNLPVLVKGKPRCTLQLHPDDAVDLGLADGDAAIVRSRVGELIAPVEVTDSVMPGVVSLPHGWGHGKPGARMNVAAEHAGVNSNVLTDPTMIDPLSGNAVLNGIPVEVVPA